MRKTFEPPAAPVPTPAPRPAPVPAHEAGPMSRQLAQWVAMDARLGRSCLCSIGTYSDLQLQERLHALHKATELQKIAMLAWHGRRTPDQVLIEAGVLVRVDEAMRVEHALRHRAALRDARTQRGDEDPSVPPTVDEPALRESALCLQSTEELLQRLSDLRRALNTRRVAPHEPGRQPHTDAPSDERLRASAARYTQQANAIACILKKRGISMR